MRLISCLFCLLMLSESGYAVQGWMWFNNFPWVYSHEDENWLYLTPKIEISTHNGTKWQEQDSSYISNMGWVWVNKHPFAYSNNEKGWLNIATKNNEILYAFGIWNNEWSQFESYQHDWDKQYEKWILDAKPYGGLSILKQIKEAKGSRATSLELYHNNNSNITDLSPLAGLSNLTELDLSSNNINDLTPLAGLTNLTSLWLDYNNITDITPLVGLTNLTELDLYKNNITDISALAGLTNLTSLWLDFNNISASQKSMLEDALFSNTTIYW
jgi:hypothetical protein